jgi:hypothetical protein
MSEFGNNRLAKCEDHEVGRVSRDGGKKKSKVENIT